MSVVELEDIPREESRDLESQLWSLLGSGDNLQCPLHEGCKVRLEGNLCPSEVHVTLKEILDTSGSSTCNYHWVKHIGHGKIGELIEALANRFLDKAKIYSPPVPDKLALMVNNQHPVEVRLIQLNTLHGASWRLNDRWVIYLNSKHERACRRFTLFHEAFHILAHSRIVSYSPGKLPERGPFFETTANSFAFYILTPATWVKKHWQKTPGIDKLAAVFDVPKRAMCIRLKYLGLI